MLRAMVYIQDPDTVYRCHSKIIHINMYDIMVKDVSIQKIQPSIITTVLF